jgi:hypothetical protein
MTTMFSLIIIDVAFSSVNWALNSKPILVKKSTDLFRSLTGKLTKIFSA